MIPILKEMQLFGTIDGKYGCKISSFTERAMILYELGRFDASICTFYILQQGLVITSFELCASEAQKEKYLPGLVNLDLIGCWGLTEPDFGSDASALQTVATPVKGGFQITGLKRWIGNAPISDLMVLYAKNSQTNKI